LEKKPTEAFDIFYPLMLGVDLIFEEGNPAGIKAMLNNLNICGLEVRLPLMAASIDLQLKIDNFVKKIKS
jgi:4-hydroxy-tetrahydrodipicolinate synthase